MRRIHTKTVAFVALCALAVVVFLWMVARDPLNAAPSTVRSVLLRSAFVQNLLPTYHALRKLPDLLFFPFYFRPSVLPTYHLLVQPVELLALSENLPKDHIGGQLTNELRTSVNGFFQSGQYRSAVKIRYRGTSAHHWNSFQRSLKVKFPADNLFERRDELNLIIPYDRGYFVEPLNFYRAEKLGLTVLPMQFVRVGWNGEDMGVYLASPSWSDKLLDGWTSPLIVYGSDDARGAANAEKKGNTSVSVTLQTTAGPVYLTNYTGRSLKGGLEALMTLVYDADDDAFRKLIGTLVDLPKFYAWNIVNILAGSVHYDDVFGNLFLIFNTVTGRFELSPWDPGLRAITAEGGGYEDDRMRLGRRILSIPEFRAERNRLLKAYLENEDNLRDDLAFYDSLYRDMKKEFFTDGAKLYNNFQFMRQVRTFRDIIAQNARDTSFILSLGDEYYRKASDRGAKSTSALAFADSFAALGEVARTIDEFAARHPSFVRRGSRDLVLPAGVHYFQETVIVPPALRLSIEPGATIYLGAGVSILSYSSVTARGAAAAPVRLLRANPDKPWGVFAVVNAPDASTLEYVNVSGGSGATHNGITFTGMISFFNSDIVVRHGTFSDAHDDDAFNAKYARVVLRDSLWQDNAHDGVDLDWAETGSEITGSRFFNNGIGGGEGGDAIDLSRSALPVRKNTIDGCTDKGISVGEKSFPVITGNTIVRCATGIAVKDLSEAIIANTSISAASVGVDAYQKHATYGGGFVRASRVRMESVAEEYRKDAFSTIETTL